jgi:hypothetical protein
MNGNFLKRIFSCGQFAEDYKMFLRKNRAMQVIFSSWWWRTTRRR